MAAEGVEEDSVQIVDNIRILGIELELACNRGSCGAIFPHANIFNDIPPHKPPLQASSSSIPRIRILSIDNKKSEETSWSVTNTRLVIDLYRDNPVFYDKKCKDYGNQVATKKVFSPILVKFKNTITIEEIKKKMAYTAKLFTSAYEKARRRS